MRSCVSGKIVKFSVGALPLLALAATGCHLSQFEEQTWLRSRNWMEVPEGYTDAWAFYPSGESYDSVLQIRKLGPKVVQAGQTYTYYIEAFNPTDTVLLRNLYIKDYVDRNLELESATPDWEDVEPEDNYEGEKQEGRHIDDVPIDKPKMLMKKGNGMVGEGAEQPPAMQWYFDELWPEKKITIRVNARAIDEGLVRNCVTAVYEIAACVKTEVNAPALDLTATLAPDLLICDRTATLTATVRNTGTGPASNVMLTSSLPSGLTTTSGESQISAALGTIPAGGSQTMTAALQAAGSGDYDVMVTATGDGGLETKSGTMRVSARKQSVTVGVTGPEKAFVGIPVDYTVSVRNNGEVPLTNVMVSSSLPGGGMSFVSATDGGSGSGAGASWNVASLGVGEEKSFSVTYRTDNVAGNVRNVVTATAECSSAEETITTIVEGVPAMVVEVIDIEDPRRVGEEEVYEITVTNQGSADETNIVVRCNLEEAMTFISGGGATNTSAPAGSREIVFEPYGRLAPKQSIKWTVRANCLSEGDIRFKVEVDSDQHDRPIMETEATRIYK